MFVRPSSSPFSQSPSASSSTSVAGTTIKVANTNSSSVEIRHKKLKNLQNISTAFHRRRQKWQTTDYGLRTTAETADERLKADIPGDFRRFFGAVFGGGAAKGGCLTAPPTCLAGWRK